MRLLDRSCRTAYRLACPVRTIAYRGRLADAVRSCRPVSGAGACPVAKALSVAIAAVAIVASSSIAHSVTVAIGAVAPIGSLAPAVIAIPGMMSAIGGALSGPIVAVTVAHHVTSSATVEDIDAIAGIIILIVPAAAISDIGKAIAIVAGIIIIERRVGVAVIAAVVDITVAIIARAAVHAAA